MNARVDPKSFEPALEALHPDWRDGWLPSVRGAAIRARLAADPRLDGRLARSLADRLGAPEPDPAALSGPDQAAYLAALAGPARFRRLLGLAWHAVALADVIDGDRLRRYGAEIPAADLEFALSLDALPFGARELPSPERFPAAADAEGARLLGEWGAQLPPAFGLRLALLAPKSANRVIDKLQSEKDCLSFLVHRVAEFIEPRR